MTLGMECIHPKVFNMYLRDMQEGLRLNGNASILVDKLELPFCFIMCASSVDHHIKCFTLVCNPSSSLLFLLTLNLFFVQIQNPIYIGF